MAPHAIATVWNDRVYRSILEGIVAAFFTRQKWLWSYEALVEPGWISDFVLGETNTLVSVKPFCSRRDREFFDAIKQIEDSNYRGRVVLMGADPILLNPDRIHNPDKEQRYPPILGYLRETTGLVYDLHFGYTEGNGRLGLCPLDGLMRNVIWRLPDYMKEINPGNWSRVSIKKSGVNHCLDPFEIMRRDWALACNENQYKKPDPSRFRRR